MLLMLNSPMSLLCLGLMIWFVKSLLQAFHESKIPRRPSNVLNFPYPSKHAEQMNQWSPKVITLAHQWYCALRYLWGGPNEIEAHYLKVYSHEQKDRCTFHN